MGSKNWHELKKRGKIVLDFLAWMALSGILPEN